MSAVLSFPQPSPRREQYLQDLQRIERLGKHWVLYDPSQGGKAVRFPSMSAARRYLRRVEKASNPSRKPLPSWASRLSVPDRHALRIALDTMNMPPAMAGVMGGDSPEQAARYVEELRQKATGKRSNPHPLAGGGATGRYIVRDWRGRIYGRTDSHSDAQMMAQRLAISTNHRAQAIDSEDNRVIGNYLPSTAYGPNPVNPTDDPSDLQAAYDYGFREGEAAKHRDESLKRFIHDSYRKWLHLYADRKLRPQLEAEWRRGFGDGAGDAPRQNPPTGGVRHHGRLYRWRRESEPHRLYADPQIGIGKDWSDDWYANWGQQFVELDGKTVRGVGSVGGILVNEFPDSYRETLEAAKRRLGQQGELAGFESWRYAKVDRIRGVQRNPRQAPVDIPHIITHHNMGPLLDALTREPEFQPGPTTHRYDPKDWYRKTVYLEFPTGELAKGGLQNMALVGRRATQQLPITKQDRFNAQGLEGKVRVEKDLFGALMNLRDLLPEGRGQIVVPGRSSNPDSNPLRPGLRVIWRGHYGDPDIPAVVVKQLQPGDPEGGPGLDYQIETDRGSISYVAGEELRVDPAYLPASRPSRRTRNGRTVTPKYVLEIPGQTASAWSGRLPSVQGLEKFVMEYVVSTYPGYPNEQIGQTFGISIPSRAVIRANHPGAPPLVEWKAPPFLVLPKAEDYPRVKKIRNPNPWTAWLVTYRTAEGRTGTLIRFAPSREFAESSAREALGREGWEVVSVKPTADPRVERNPNVVGGREEWDKSDWGQALFDAGKQDYLSGFLDPVANANRARYGLAHWMSNNVGTGDRLPRGVTKAYLLKSYRQGMAAGSRTWDKQHGKNPQGLSQEFVSGINEQYGPARHVWYLGYEKGHRDGGADLPRRWQDRFERLFLTSGKGRRIRGYTAQRQDAPIFEAGYDRGYTDGEQHSHRRLGNPAGDWITWQFRDKRGTLRVLTGKVLSYSSGKVTFRSDGGQPGYPRGKRVTVNESEVQLSESPFAPHNKRNPEDSAAELYEQFHGRPSTHIEEHVEEIHVHENLTELGILTELKVATVNNLDVTLAFDPDDPDKRVKLASSEDGKQLFFVGGDQSLNLDQIKMGSEKWVRDSMVLGVLYELTYRTEKGFDKFKLTDYYHKLGEESGRQPILLYDTINRCLSVSGGAYQVKPEGIVD